MQAPTGPPPGSRAAGGGDLATNIERMQTGDAGVMAELPQAQEAVQQPVADPEMSVVIGATAGNAVQQPIADQEMSVVIEGATHKITKRFFPAKDMADVFRINTSVIADFDEDALIEKVVQGPSFFQGLWNVILVMMAFAPNLYSKSANAKKALAKTSIADYPSRKEVKMMHHNVS
jgi:hypothetical protein